MRSDIRESETFRRRAGRGERESRANRWCLVCSWGWIRRLSLYGPSTYIPTRIFPHDVLITNNELNINNWDALGATDSVNHRSSRRIWTSKIT